MRWTGMSTNAVLQISRFDEITSTFSIEGLGDVQLQRWLLLLPRIWKLSELSPEWNHFCRYHVRAVISIIMIITPKKWLHCSDFSWRCAQDQGQCPGGGGYTLGDCGNSEVTLPPNQTNPPNPTTDDGQPEPTTDAPEPTTDDGSDGSDDSGAMSVKSSIVLSSMVALIVYLQNLV